MPICQDSHEQGCGKSGASGTHNFLGSQLNVIILLPKFKDFFERFFHFHFLFLLIHHDKSFFSFMSVLNVRRPYMIACRNEIIYGRCGYETRNLQTCKLQGVYQPLVRIPSLLCYIPILYVNEDKMTILNLRVA